MPPRSDLAGQKFNRLTVLRAAGTIDGRSAWECQCDCGGTKVVVGKALTTGNTKSCGCLQVEARLANGKGNLRHGHAKSGSKGSSRTYNTWFSMKSRCERVGDRMYAEYGGAGITVCERWQTFSNFLEDMGERPAGTSLDRVDGTKGYSKDNCRWATPLEQAENRRSTHKFLFRGEQLTITAVAQRWGISRERVKYHLVTKRATVEELLAITFPVDAKLSSESWGDLKALEAKP